MFDQHLDISPLFLTQVFPPEMKPLYVSHHVFWRSFLTSYLSGGGESLPKTVSLMATQSRQVVFYRGVDLRCLRRGVRRRAPLIARYRRPTSPLSLPTPVAPEWWRGWRYMSANRGLFARPTFEAAVMNANMNCPEYQRRDLSLLNHSLFFGVFLIKNKGRESRSLRIKGGGT